MSWFNETFGDSLNSLKGQITKITKEVLADDEATQSERHDSEKLSVRELEALCESKDLEIASLREEFSKLQSQYNSQLKQQQDNKTDDRNAGDDSRIKKLENELVQLRNERDHLNSCLDELQSEHQVNLNQVISIKDKYKSELEALKKGKSVESNTEKIDQVESAEISLLNSKLSALQLQLEEEKEKSKAAAKAGEEAQISLKNQLEKLLGEIQAISKGKSEAEEVLEKITTENKDLKNKLINQEKEVKENEIKLKLLSNEKEELLIKYKQEEEERSKLSSLIKTDDEVEQKLKNLLEILNVDVKEIIKENNTIGLINLIENKIHHSNKQHKNQTEMTNGLELEIKKLKEENSDLQNRLKVLGENSSEMEKNYRDEISCLKNSLSEMKTQDCINQSQTDDVKRLEQEIAQCMSSILTKNNEIADYAMSVKNLEQELKKVKELSSGIEKELSASLEEKKKLDEENLSLRNSISKMTQEKGELEEGLEALRSQNISMNDVHCQLQTKIAGLEEQITNLSSGHEGRIKMLQEELLKASSSKSEGDNLIRQLQSENANLKSELENLKAQVIIRESSLVELTKANSFLQEEVNKLQAQNNQLINSEAEISRWKDTSVDLQIQKEDLLAVKEQLENECQKLKNDLEVGLRSRDAEIENLKVTNSNLMKSCNDLHVQLESKCQAENLSASRGLELEENCQKQSELILQLQEENSELKSRVQKFQEQMKMQMLQTQPVLKEDVLQHRRSKSAVESEPPFLLEQKAGPHASEDLMLVKQALQQEQAKYQLLQHQFQEISNKEANARKEFERLKKHLIEVEDHYTEEAVENEKVINDLKSKLVAAEEQLQNSSTLYTSLKVRDNQHLESLQSQVKMVSAQRDDLQGKVSAAEDEIQKHKASLMSLQIVLEQFQQDKEREIEEVAMKYEKKLQLSDERYRNLEMEIQCLNNQLGEAKNGLKAAARLGEQLEKKAEQVAELEEKLKNVTGKMAELEEGLATANQANNGKVDKSLIKNLVVGYILSANADRKAQVLRIMASVLDFDQEERNKMGVDTGRTRWLSSILHPKADGAPNNQSLAEAFIKFLENESRPQPQLKLLPEQLEASSSKSSRTSPKPSGRLSELTLPTFNSSQENESSSILKNVLKDS